MILLNANGLKKMFLDETLFDGVSFNVDSNDKIGFIGANGAGKSTLFKIITGEMEYDSGEMFFNKFTKIGYLEQYACSDSENTIMQEMLEVFDDVIKIENELEDIRFEIENNPQNINQLINRQTALQEEFEKADGFFYKNKIKSTLIGLGFNENDFQTKVSHLSGGQKTRISLGKILLSDANLLLLDEPTNHLDVDSIEWLESFLQSYKGAFIIISHDRYFLDKVTNKTFELEVGNFRSYNGGYSAYMAQREIDKKTEERNYENTVREIERLEGIVEQQRRWNREKNIKTAESKMKVIEKLEKDLVKPTLTADDIAFKFKALPGGGNDAIMCENLSMAFGEKKLFENANMLINKGEKVFLLGPNGCGKTTFLKILLGMYTQKEGSYKIGANTEVGYYDQLQENLNVENEIIDEIRDTYPQMTNTQIRNALAVFLFRGEDVFKEIKKLSGGERARVELTMLMLKSVNLLIMDEPTNHLDIASREALENALSNYDGTMLMVSHDRYFINKMADRILYLTPTGLESYIGGYDDFIAKRKAPEIVQEKKVSTGATDYKEQKRLEAQKRKVLNRFNKVEEEISQVEDMIEQKNNELLAPEVATDYVMASQLTTELDELNTSLETLYTEWEELQTEIEENEYI